VVVF